MARSRLAMVMFSAAGLAVSGAVPAVGQTVGSVGCGAVIRADTTLGADLLNCAGDGLLVGADNITVNLNGHTVSGDSSQGTADVGIRVQGHHSVTVTNGSVSRFDRAVVFETSPDGVVTAMKIHDNSGRGIVFLSGSDRGRIQRDLSADNGASGIAVVSSDNVVVHSNRSLRNLGGAGVRLESAKNTTVTHNVLNGNDLGAQVVAGSTHNRISDNTLTGDPEGGVLLDSSDRNLVTHNVVTDSSPGVGIGGNDNVIADNQVRHSSAPDGIGIQLDGNHNLIALNTVTDSIRYGIEVDDFPDNGSPATATMLRDNVVNGAVVGIAIGPEAGGVVLNTLIQHNFVTGAVDDGIQLTGPSTGLETSTLTRNVAVHNGNLGIETVPGTIDGGGNHAAGNGNPLQCLNIACH